MHRLAGRRVAVLGDNCDQLTGSRWVQLRLSGQTFAAHELHCVHVVGLFDLQVFTFDHAHRQGEDDLKRAFVLVHVIATLAPARFPLDDLVTQDPEHRRGRSLAFMHRECGPGGTLRPLPRDGTLPGIGCWLELLAGCSIS